MDDDAITAALAEVGAAWLMDPDDEACQAKAIRHLVEAAVAAERERWKALRGRIRSDINRPEGRWGVHGHTAVDDDYFCALEWVLERMDEVLGPNVRGNAGPTAAQKED